MRHYVAKTKCESHSHRKEHQGMTTGGSAGGRAVKKGVEYAKRVETNKEMVLRVEDQHKSPSYILYYCQRNQKPQSPLKAINSSHTDPTQP